VEILEALKDLPLTAWREEIIRATHHHDWGKAHSIFQRTLHGTPEVLDVYESLLAKSQRGGKHTRPHFRHELASALALLQPELRRLALRPRRNSRAAFGTTTNYPPRI
jgi:hypothetical protein